MPAKYPDHLEQFRAKEGHVVSDSKAEILQKILESKFCGKMKTRKLSAEKTLKVFDYKERSEGTFVLFQVARVIREACMRYPKKIVKYNICIISHGEIISTFDVDATGQNIHFYIRNGMSPIRYIIDKEFEVR